MQRSPIVLAATVAGTAGVLAFHARTPTVSASGRATPAAAVTATADASPTVTAAAGARKAAGISGTATGTAVDTPYGAAQVRVTVADGKITAVRAVQLQGGNPRSVQISASAEPVLRQEALGAQTAAVDAVSGATFTSASYEQSLQSALDKLGFKAPGGSRATLSVPG